MVLASICDFVLCYLDPLAVISFQSLHNFNLLSSHCIELECMSQLCLRMLGSKIPMDKKLSVKCNQDMTEIDLPTREFQQALFLGTGTTKYSDIYSAGFALLKDSVGIVFQIVLFQTKCVQYCKYHRYRYKTSITALPSSLP